MRVVEDGKVVGGYAAGEEVVGALVVEAVVPEGGCGCAVDDLGGGGVNMLDCQGEVAELVFCVVGVDLA